MFATCPNQRTRRARMNLSSFPRSSGVRASLEELHFLHSSKELETTSSAGLADSLRRANRDLPAHMHGLVVLSENWYLAEESLVQGDARLPHLNHERAASVRRADLSTVSLVCQCFSAPLDSSLAHVVPNDSLDRPAGSHPLAADGQRGALGTARGARCLRSSEDDAGYTVNVAICRSACQLRAEVGGGQEHPRIPGAQRTQSPRLPLRIEAQLSICG